MSVISRCRRAFTLIELLVVIAIIAILAAILFPVFTRAKESAKLTQSLSQIKQIGTAFHIYSANFDDRFITVERSVYDYCNPRAGDAVVRLSPYIKNYEIWFDPSRRDRRNPYSASACTWNPKNYLLGYGTNFGVWSIWDETGMYRNPRAGEPYGAAIGYQTTDVEEPGRFILAGTTNDYPYYTLSLYFQATEGRGQQYVRFSGRWPYTFADGHAKSIGVRSYSVTGATSWTILHQAREDMLGFCIQKSKISTDYNITCEQLVDRIIQYRVPVQ